MANIMRLTFGVVLSILTFFALLACAWPGGTVGQWTTEGQWIVLGILTMGGSVGLALIVSAVKE